MSQHSVVLTKMAETDLDQIADFLEDTASAYARQLLIALRDTVDALGHLPESQVPIASSRKRGFVIRHVRVDSYLIYYRVEALTVFVTRIRHGARQPLKRFD